MMLPRTTATAVLDALLALAGAESMVSVPVGAVLALVGSGMFATV